MIEWDSPDRKATFSGGEYTVLGDVVNRQHAIRVLAYEERFLNFEQKFFCNRPTEKTVTLTVSMRKHRISHICLLTLCTTQVFDHWGTGADVETPKVTCQYPIMDIQDTSQENVDNIANFAKVPFHVIRPMTPFEDYEQ